MFAHPPRPRRRRFARRPAARALLSAVAILLAAPAATASDGAPAILPEEVADVARADWTGDGLDDLAILTGADGEASLWLFYSDDSLAGIGFSTRASVIAYGDRPRLALNARGSLQVVTADGGIGRSRWSQTLTLAFRDGEMRVAGFTYESRDTITGETERCDVNLLNGRGERNGRAFRTRTPATPVEDWTDGTTPDGCF